jgi:phosphoserine phosphatase
VISRVALTLGEFLATKIILTRHGDVPGIEPVRFRGREDIPLTDLGRKQADAVGARIASLWRPVTIYTSPLQRCVYTGNAIAKASGISCGAIDDLNDLHYGAWQWKTHVEIKSSSPELYTMWHRSPHLIRFPGGESLQDLVARTSNVIRQVLRKHPGHTVVLVGHDSVNRALVLQILDQPLSAYWRIHFDPCGLTEIDFVDGGPTVKRINDVGHLEILKN